MPSPHVVYVPIEIFSRELPSKLLLSAELARTGNSIVLGDKAQVLRLALKDPKPGIILMKSAESKRHDGIYQALESKGFQFFAQDEEAGLVLDYEQFFSVRPSLKNVCALDGFFCWDEREYNALTRKFPECAGKIHLTGGLRAALWGQIGSRIFRNRSVALSAKYGHFVLISTNFGAGNHHLGWRGLLRLTQRLKYSGWSRDDLVLMREQQRSMITHFARVAKMIGQNSAYSVILRPHPAESVLSWKLRFLFERRVKVIRKGDITPWILASKLLIQNGCHTGIEALELGKPVVAYMPLKKYGLNSSKINEIVPSAQTPDELLSIVNKVAEGEPKRDSGNAEESRWNLYRSGTLRPVQQISGLLTESPTHRSYDCNEFLSPLSRLELVMKILVRGLRSIVDWRLESVVARHKRPWISQKEIEDLLLECSTVLRARTAPAVVRLDGQVFLVRTPSENYFGPKKSRSE